MAVLLTLIACFLLYGKSKYFPQQWQNVTAPLRKNKAMTRGLGYALLLIAAVIFVLDWGGFTGFVIWVTILMLAYSVLVIALPVWQKLLAQKQSS